MEKLKNAIDVNDLLQPIIAATSNDFREPVKIIWLQSDLKRGFEVIKAARL